MHDLQEYGFKEVGCEQCGSTENLYQFDGEEVLCFEHAQEAIQDIIDYDNQRESDYRESR